MYKNYFMAKAISNNSIRVVYYALKGLEILKKDQIFFVNNGPNHLLVDSSDNKLTYSVKDAFGNATKIASIEKVTLVQLDDKTMIENITSSAKIVGKDVEVSFNNIVDMKWASYAIKFHVKNDKGGDIYLTKTFVVKTQIFETVSTSFAQTANWDYPAKYQVSSGYPVQFDQLDSNKYPIVHIQLDAQFFGDKDKTENP